MNRPGFSTPVGSNCALMLLISASASPELPQNVHFRFDFERAAQDDERASASFQILPQILKYIEKGAGIVPLQPKVPDSDRLSDEPPRPLQRLR